MTINELDEACVKFQDYLKANDVHVLAHMLYVEGGPTGQILSMGGEELLLDLLLILTAHNRGWNVVQA